MTDNDKVARRTATLLGPIGVWSSALAQVPADRARAAVADIERMGYGALWVGESPGSREAFTHAGLLLAATERLIVATGIANIWLRDPSTMNAAANTLGEAYPDRFVLGIGASHAAALAVVGRTYDKPLTAMRTYLDTMDSAFYLSPRAPEPVPVVLAALRSRMQELARDRAAGMHSFFVTPEHTAAARQTLGAGPLLVPEQAVVIDTDRDTARDTARNHVKTRLALTNYVNHVRALGFTESDLADGGSDRLVDSLVAWGDVDTVAARVRLHLDAGADHVAVHVLDPVRPHLGLGQLRELAAALGLAPNHDGVAGF